MVDAVQAAWTAAGRSLPRQCEALDRIYITSMVQGDLDGWCAREGLRSCSNTARDLFEGPRMNVYVIDTDPRTHDRLVLHEIEHVLRGCWVLEAQQSPDYHSRYFMGREDPECVPRTMQDWGHCDVPLWTRIEADATRRWEGR